MLIVEARRALQHCAQGEARALGAAAGLSPEGGIACVPVSL